MTLGDLLFLLKDFNADKLLNPNLPPLCCCVGDGVTPNGEILLLLIEAPWNGDGVFMALDSFFFLLLNTLTPRISLFKVDFEACHAIRFRRAGCCCLDGGLFSLYGEKFLI